MKLYVALADALAVLDHSHGEWMPDMQLVDYAPQCVAVDPLHQEQVYCGTFDQGLWQSGDVGKSWTPVGEGIAHEKVLSVAVSATEHVNGYGVVYAGTEPTSLFRSEDRGSTWQDLAALRQLPSAPTWSFPPRPSTSHVRWIAPDPLVTGRIFAAIEAGALVRSADGGQTWEDRKPGGPRDTHTLAIPPRAPQTLYSAAGDGFFTSKDGGNTWHHSTEGLRHHYLWSVAVDAGDPAVLILSAARGPREAHDPVHADSALYRRSDDGQWEPIGAGLSETKGSLTAVLAADVAASGVFFAANNKGIFRSGDAGASWEALPIRWPEKTRLGRANALVIAQN